MSCVRPLIDDHFRVAITPDREHEMREHLAGCDECRTYYNRHLVLASLDPKAKSDEARIGVGLGFRPERAPWLSLPRLSGVVALAGAVAVLTIFVRQPAAPEFASRGASAPSVQIFTIAKSGGKAMPVEKKIAATDSLAFAYTNPDRAHRLMVFALDEHRHVYWYYPSWENPAENPQAILAPPTDKPRELPDAVQHSLDGNELEIHAVFVDKPWTVKEVEQQIASGRLDIPDAVRTETLKLTVAR
jgi:hypothetical protein